MNKIDVNSMMAQLEAMKRQAQGGAEMAPAATEGASKPDFAKLLNQSINAVNETQKQSGALQEAFQKGDPNVDIAEVMLAVQKASVSFQTMTQVRNKLLEAYQDIKNMPV